MENACLRMGNVNAFAKSFMPKFIKEVMTHVPTIAMRSVDWKGILGELGPWPADLERRPWTESPSQSLKVCKLREFNLKETGSENFSSKSAEEKKWAGEKVLELYFSQLANPAGLALDLRPSLSASPQVFALLS